MLFLKGTAAYLKIYIYIMDENDSLSEYNKFAIVPVAPFTPKSTSKLRSALHFRDSIVIPHFISHANSAQS